MKKLIPLILLFVLHLGALPGQSPSHIYIKNEYMVMTGGTSAKPVYLIINNSDTNALKPSSGWIISENEFNMVMWNIGNSTGIYRVPFGFSTSNYLPLNLNITTAGTGSGGVIKFSTYHTAALNSGAEPSDVTNLTPLILPGSPSNTDNSYNITDRFYTIDANTGYTTKPAASDITFSYISGTGSNSEVKSPNVLTESNLMAERFNSGSNIWSDWFGEGCTDAVASGIGTVQTGPVSAANFYRSWGLWDNLAPLPLLFSSTNILCNGNSTGSATITVYGGKSPYTYSWSGGGTNSTKTGLSAATYTVTVTDNSGCSGTASTTITQPTALSVTATTTTNVSCNDGNNGSLSSTPTGGTSPYTYSWSPTSNTNQNPSSLVAGTYTLTLTDNNECTATASVTITQPTALSISITAKTSAICNGGSDSLFSSPSGGISPYTYSWSPTSGLSCSTCQKPLAMPTTNITYSVTVTDNNNCTSSSSIAITVNPIPTLTIAKSPDSVFMYSLDTLTASGATTYLWNTGDTARKTYVSPSSTTTYTVQGTSSAGCIDTNTVTVFVKSTSIFPSINDTNIHQMYTNFLASYDSTAFAGDTVEDNPMTDFLKWYNYWEPRLGPTGSFKVGAESYGAYLQNIHSSSSTFCSSGTPISTTWTELGINTHSQFTSGQVHCISFDPTNSSIMYAGGLDGGVCRSTDGGANWVNMGTDVQMLDLGTSDIGIEPLNHNTVYVATGDAQSGTVFSDGVYLTADANDAGSAVWNWEGPSNLSTNGQFLHQLFIDPLNSNYLYAAIDNPNGVNLAGGIWHVTNRQSPPFSWVRDGTWGFTYINSSSNTYSSDAAFSVVGKTVSTYLGTQTRLYAAGYDIRETLPDGTWWSLTGTNSGTNGPGSGLDLGADPSSTGFPYILNAKNASYPYFIEPGTGNSLYLLLINLTLSDDGNYLYANIFTSTSPTYAGGNQYEFIARYNFTLPNPGWDISPNPLSTSTSTFPWAYDPNMVSGDGQGQDCWYGSGGRKALAIDPNDDNHIFTGTTNLSESTDGGHSWTDDYSYYSSYPPTGPHVDYHAIKFQPGNSGLVYLGTDGGLSSFNSSTPFSPTDVTDLNNGLGFSLDYDATSSEQDDGDVWQTMQDNAANRLRNNLYITFVFGNKLGDGYHNIIDYTDPNITWASGGGYSWYVTRGAQSVSPGFVGPVNYDHSDVDPGDPTFLNPYNPHTMYEGRQDVQRVYDDENSITTSNDCEGSMAHLNCWEYISDFRNQIGGTGFNYTVKALTICPTDSNYMYATLVPQTPTDYYRFAWTWDGGGTNSLPVSDWTDATPDNLNYTMSGVAVSYTNPDQVWICYQGATDPTQTHKVKSGIFSGSSWTWTNDNTGLCDNLNINCIVYQNGSNDALYVGTDAGVYYKNASMSSWERLGTTFPNVVVNSLSINYCAQKLIVGTYGRGAWETDLVPSASAPLEITSNTTWIAPPSGSQMMIPADVEIQATYTLTIDAGLTVNMSKGHQITVDPGATLIVNGTITNACGDLWAGIYVEGNASQPQTSTYQGTVILSSTATIEYAQNGITTIKNTPSGWDWSYTGGIILANGAHFYNNWRDIQFLSYGKSNTSYFKNCSFSIDDTYYSNYYAQYGLAQRVTMYQVHGVAFYGNTFANNISVGYLSVFSQRSGGIYSLDASYAVDNCNLCSSLPNCCGTANTFTGFEYGIAADNSNPSYNIQISGNSFTNNNYDIDIQNINNMVITNNTFTKGAYSGARPLSLPFPYNIYLDQCTAYNVSGNTLTNTYYSSSSNPSYGTVVNNSFNLNNLINNNSFNGIYVQSQSQGLNGLVSFTLPPIYHTYSGLQYQCNTYNSSIANGADIAVTSGLIDPMQGSCTSAYTTANNTFNNACSSPRWNLYAYPSIPPIWDIYYSTASSPAPYCESSPVYVNTCGGISTGICTPATYTLNISSGSILTANSINYHSTLRVQKQTLNYKKDSLTTILARGNTSGLYTVLGTGVSYTIIQDSLLDPGPYLSDSVLRTAIGASLPMETLANIIIPNTPLDSSVVAALDSIHLPDTLVTRLNEYQADSILSPRSMLIAGIDYFQGLMDFTDNALITALETDTNIVSAYDSAQAVLKSDTLTLPRLAQLASLQWAAGENTTAIVTLDTIHRHDVDSVYNEFYRLIPVLITLSSDSNGYLSLKGNTTDSTLLEQIAMDTLKPGYANARAVLEFVYEQTFDEPILPLVSGGMHRSKKNNNTYITGKDKTGNSTTPSLNTFDLFPNPAKNEVTIQYNLNKNIQNAGIELYDELGNKVLTWQLPTSQTQITENTANLTEGIYIYSIFVNNVVVQRGKLVIER